MVTDPESLRSKATWLLVDIASLLDPEDTAPRIATFLVEKLWQSGHELGVMVAGEQLVIVPARRGREQIARILEPLATVRAGRESQIDRLVRAASRCENPGSFIVVSAASRPESALQRLHRICPAVTFVRAQAPAHDSSVESSP